MEFKTHIGIDYSGAKKSTSLLKNIQVFQSGNGSIQKIENFHGNRKSKTWTRKDLAEWIISVCNENKSVLIGIDHAFSYPISYFARNKLLNWDAFLGHFSHKWPLHEKDDTVDDYRKKNSKLFGKNDELRMTEKWTSSAKSVFLFDVNGSVAKSTHAGIPWLYDIRRQCRKTLHFWPFDGWVIPKNKNVIVEVYPSIFKKRFNREEGSSNDEHDAYSVGRWLYEADKKNILHYYLSPPLTKEQRKIAKNEGWILGIY